MKKMSFVFLCLIVLSACNKPIIEGRDLETTPLTQIFRVPADAAFDAAEHVLTALDYKVEYADKDKGVLRTGWISTTTDSHYVDLFGREDYGTTGAYYHLAVRISSVEGGAKVEVSAPLRTIVVKMDSSGRKEKKVLAKIEDMLRPADIRVTNIGAIHKVQE
jgi:copper chaperone CopZ